MKFPCENRSAFNFVRKWSTHTLHWLNKNKKNKKKLVVVIVAVVVKVVIEYSFQGSLSELSIARAIPDPPTPEVHDKFSNL